VSYKYVQVELSRNRVDHDGCEKDYRFVRVACSKMLQHAPIYSIAPRIL